MCPWFPPMRRALAPPRRAAGPGGLSRLRPDPCCRAVRAHGDDIPLQDALNARLTVTTVTGGRPSTGPRTKVSPTPSDSCSLRTVTSRDRIRRGARRCTGRPYGVRARQHTYSRKPGAWRCWRLATPKGPPRRSSQPRRGTRASGSSSPTCRRGWVSDPSGRRRAWLWCAYL